MLDKMLIRCGYTEYFTAGVGTSEALQFLIFASGRPLGLVPVDTQSFFLTIRGWLTYHLKVFSHYSTAYEC